MNEKILMLIYFIIVFFIMLFVLITKKKNAGYYQNLDKKEHPLKFLYPAAAFLYKKAAGIFKLKPKRKITEIMKRLYVKENVKEELFLYTVKKYATILGILLGVSILGLLICLSHQSVEYIQTLNRNSYGNGETSYSLDAHYKGEDETVEIGIDEIKYTEDEINEKFEKDYEEIKKEMLGENESEEHVNKPVNLISSYDGISISWEIEDPKVLDYNGEISEDVKEDDEILLNLYATFTIDDVSKVYTMPIVVSGTTKTDNQKLAEEIKENIDENNSAYEGEVKLPETLDGEEISFSESTENNAHIFLILGILAVFLIAFSYDKTLEKELKKRKEEMLIDFTEIVSKLSLLYEAGMSILMAWEKIVVDYEKKNKGKSRFAYQEMKLTLEKIKSGTSEREAYAEFGNRCGLHPYIKLGNILEQNLTKGTKGMKVLLKQEVEDAFEERKRLAKKKGEEASTKLLFPMIIMLVIVIVIIAVPALLTMQL